jgi:glycosyltransferase involved in cell wall biosynthesis
MKILHILNELRFSGAEVMLTSAAELFFADGDSHTVLSMGATLGEYAPAMASAGYQLAHIPFAKTPTFFVRLFRFMRDGRYDVVHIHAERASFYTGLIALTSAPRVVRTVHSTFGFEGFLKLLRRWQRVILERLGVIFIACSPLVARNENARFKINPVVVNNWFDPRRTCFATEKRRSEARRSLGLLANGF